MAPAMKKIARAKKRILEPGDFTFTFDLVESVLFFPVFFSPFSLISANLRTISPKTSFFQWKPHRKKKFLSYFIATVPPIST